MKEFISAVADVIDEDNAIADEEKYVEFKLDGREMRAFTPTDGQLVFMLASMGRGQSSDQRFASIINVMLECLRDEDRDYMEGRLLTRDKTKRLDPEKINEIFEYLTEEWFARPTQPSSDSAPSPQSDGVN